MNVLDLFSGIGGFSLGLERAGMRTVAFCERDEFCRAVLAKHWPGIPCFDDIHTLDADRLGGLGPIDIVCGGFPCQPFSVAGDQRAHEDDRFLWPEMRRIVACSGCTWVLGENVTGIVTLALDDVLSDLEGLGYTPRAFVIPACAVDAPHRRDRVWIVAAHADRLQLWKQSRRCDGADGQDSAESRDNGAQGSLANANRSRLEGTRDERSQESHERARQSLFGGDGSGRRWDPEPNVGRVAHGIPARAHRIRALGNAVVPQLVEEIGRAIMRTHHE